MIYWATQTADLEHQITQLGIKTVLIASLIMIGCTIIAALLKNHYERLKLPLFIIMAATLVISTVTLFGSTIYLNVKAESGGPVHWHTDIEFWACGTELNLRDPQGALTNKIGTATFHEHNDKRVHLEGVVVKKSVDASLDKFMRVTGGYIRDDAIGIPLNFESDTWLAAGDQIDGDQQRTDRITQLNEFATYLEYPKKGAVLQMKNGDTCGDQTAELQVFTYTYNKDDQTYSQRKMERPGEYVMRDEGIVPPGDCVIVEFDSPKVATDKLCRQYGVRDAQRCKEFGVENPTPELCNIREVNRPSQPAAPPPAAAAPRQLNEGCSNYLKNKDNPRYRPALTTAQIADCQKQIAEIEAYCKDPANRSDHVVHPDCAEGEEGHAH